MATELRLDLVTQSGEITTVAQGEIPVLLVQGGSSARREAVKALNFLRSGAPSVTFVVEGFNEEAANNLAAKIYEVFDGIKSLEGTTYDFTDDGFEDGLLILGVRSDE